MLAFVYILVCTEIAAAHDIVLVTSKNSQVRVMPAADLARIIKTTHKWPGGHELIVVLTDPSSLEMRIVAQKLLSLTRDEFKNLIDATNKTKMTFWVVSSDDEVLKIVQSRIAAAEAGGAIESGSNRPGECLLHQQQRRGIED